MAIGSVPKIAANVVIMIGRKRSSAASRIACSALKPTRRRSSAKSTIMMAFFLTMPTSITMPIIAMTDSSIPNSINVRIAPMPADGRPDVMVSGWIDAELRLHLQDDLIVVGRHVDGTNLPRAIGVVELVADLIDGDAVDRGLFAVDIDRHLRVLDVKVGGDVEQARHLLDLLAHFRSQPVKRLCVTALQDVLILPLRNAATNTEILDALEECLHARDLARGLTQTPDHHGGIVTRVPRLQRNEQATVVCGRI